MFHLDCFKNENCIVSNIHMYVSSLKIYKIIEMFVLFKFIKCLMKKVLVLVIYFSHIILTKCSDSFKPLLCFKIGGC